MVTNLRMLEYLKQQDNAVFTEGVRKLVYTEAVVIVQKIPDYLQVFFFVCCLQTSGGGGVSESES